MDTSAWDRSAKLAAVLPSGRPVYAPVWDSDGKIELTPEARYLEYTD